LGRFEIHIIDYAIKYEEAHANFASKFYPQKRRRIPEYIYWKFRSKQIDKCESFILAVKEDKVVGQLGLLPVVLKIGEDSFEAQWFCDLMLDPTLRGHGIAAMLFEFAFKKGKVSIGSDPSPSAYKSMLRNGFKELKAQERIVIPISIADTCKIFFNKRFSLLNFKNPFLSANSFFTKHNHHEITYGVDPINLNCGDEPHILHDRLFNLWRYSGFIDFYKRPETMYFKETGEFLSFYIVNRQIYIAEHSVYSGSTWRKVISHLYKYGISKELFAIRLLATRDEFRKLMRFGAIMRHKPTVILYRDCPMLDHHDYFHYTYLDSDQGI